MRDQATRLTEACPACVDDIDLIRRQPSLRNAVIWLPRISLTLHPGYARYELQLAGRHGAICKVSP